MATGLGVRDFFKEYREERYSNSGAIRLTEIEHNAYVNRLTVEITHFDAPRAINYKTLPENTHWGYLTGFKGSSVITNTPVKFVKQRVFDLTNNAIWQYHQHKECVDVITGAVQSYGNLALGELSDLGDGVGVVGIFINAIEGLEDLTAPAFSWLYEQVTGNESPEDVPTKAYTPYPIASPFPDVFKFKSDIPVSFLFRLESWYLVNPLVYIVANPTDTGDETAGENEYPEPQPGDGDGDSQEFPQSSPNDPRNDERDGGQRPAPELIEGVVYTWDAVVTGIALSAGGQIITFTEAVEFQSVVNGQPFTGTTTGNRLLTFAGEGWFGGVNILNRFGQVITTVLPGTGFRANSVSITFSVRL